MNQVRTGAQRPRASIRVGILPERAGITGCFWTVSPPEAIKNNAMEWAEKRYGKEATDSGKNHVFVDTPGMLVDIIVGFSRIKMRRHPDRDRSLG